MRQRTHSARSSAFVLLAALWLLGPVSASAEEVTEPTDAAEAAEAEFTDLVGPSASPPAPAPAPPSSAARVVGVQIQGNRRIDADAVRAVLGSRPGGQIDRARIADDVRKIYALGFFRNVTVVSKDAPGGQILTFVVEENPVIRRVSISGNDNLASDDIKDKLTVTVGSTIDRPLILENEGRIRAVYQAKGYYLAKVSHELEPLAEGAVAVNFDVLEGEKLRLRKVVFEGNESLSDKQLTKAMQTKPWAWTSLVTHFWDNSGLYAEPIFYQDLDRISRLYMDKGHIRVKVSEPQVDITEDGITVSVPISEGPRFIVGEVDVIGDSSMDRDQLLGLVDLAPGAVFNRGLLSDDVERLRSFYADRGFFDARVNPRTQVDADALTVSTSFEVEKNELFFVDRIEVNGNTRTRDPVVRRELSISEGELYSASAVERSRARVRRLGFFEEVAIEAKPLDNANRVGLEIDVVERPTGSFSFGAGVGSTDGFVLNASVRQDNLFGQGRGLTASGDLGSQNSRFFLSYTEPYAFGSMSTLSATLSQTKREFLDFDEQIKGLNFQISYPLDESETSVGTGYSFTSREVSGVDDFQASSLLQREEFQGDTTTSMITLSVRRDTRDDIRFPKSGHVTGGALEFAGLGGLNDFLRIEGRTTWFLPMDDWLPFESTFVFNSRIGWAVPFNDVSDFDLPPCAGIDCQTLLADNPSQFVNQLDRIDADLELPLTERYFLGGLGAFQVRGFKQRSLGPRRAILNQSGATFVSGADRLFFPNGWDPLDPGPPGPARGVCRLPTGCNTLLDNSESDFADLDLTDVIGGNKMLLVNLELQFPISDELGLTGIWFLDMGNAFGEDEAINPADLRFGTGGGIQWFSPFGPIMVVLGVPLDRLEDEDASVFEFSLGGSQF